MARADAIQAEGEVVEILPNLRFRVELANGHRVLAYTTGRTRMSFARLSIGDRVTVEMSPYDLSKGMITVEANRV